MSRCEISRYLGSHAYSHPGDVAGVHSDLAIPRQVVYTSRMGPTGIRLLVLGTETDSSMSTDSLMLLTQHLTGQTSGSSCC